MPWLFGQFTRGEAMPEAKKLIHPTDYSPYFAPFASVETFMLAAGHLEDCPREYRSIDYDKLDLYMKFIKEEYLEELLPAHNKIKELLKKQSLTEEEYKEVEALFVLIVDGLFDLIWVSIGAFLTTGVPMDGIWQAGAMSNLAKIDPLTNKIEKREDGKILKPAGWKPPDFAGIIKEHLDKTGQD
jgi:predicted HAD superfamily Cof-like phosphohydrolase